MSVPSYITDAARELATRAHAGQTYPPSKPLPGVVPFDPPVVLPFIVHPSQVVGVLARFGLSDPYLVAAAWLHDILEDTDTKPEALSDVDAGVGYVRHIVEALTDEPGANRKERKAKTYPKIVQAGEYAINVKLADRIANVESSIIGYACFGYYGIYVQEYKDFSAALRPAGGRKEMWQHLDYLLGAPG